MGHPLRQGARDHALRLPPDADPRPEGSPRPLAGAGDEPRLRRGGRALPEGRRLLRARADGVPRGGVVAPEDRPDPGPAREAGRREELQALPLDGRGLPAQLHRHGRDSHRPAPGVPDRGPSGPPHRRGRARPRHRREDRGAAQGRQERPDHLGAAPGPPGEGHRAHRRARGARRARARRRVPHRLRRPGQGAQEDPDPAAPLLHQRLLVADRRRRRSDGLAAPARRRLRGRAPLRVDDPRQPRRPLRAARRGPQPDPANGHAGPRRPDRRPGRGVALSLRQRHSRRGVLPGRGDGGLRRREGRPGPARPRDRGGAPGPGGPRGAGLLPLARRGPDRGQGADEASLVPRVQEGVGRPAVRRRRRLRHREVPQPLRGGSATPRPRRTRRSRGPGSSSSRAIRRPRGSSPRAAGTRTAPSRTSPTSSTRTSGPRGCPTG